ncbi:hypothetical protein IAG44_41645 [Streptomyces roseirectus]|uniref:Uncharacterized protein n=1 Tax=Streptomyces roseirectus TaxID=2768066 RepID=A0A7H0IR59_9ACTN|nr:hypothetical protein [Streptomyces roseirectus]QNP75275.1 hypothetical protein IAG44_41645 [Streptomyces roseirectus]
MNDPGPPPPRKMPGEDFPAAPGTPSAYHGVGLIPPAGPARTWGLAVVGVPLVLVLLLALAGNLSGDSDNSGRSGSTWSGTSGWPGTYETTEETPETLDATDTPSPDDSDTPTPYDSTTAPAYEESPTPSVSSSAFEESPTPSPADTTGPEAVVTAYFEAINNRDYATAWALGGKNLDSDYDTFAAGFATTRSDTITINSVQGDEVALTLEARQTDGTTKTFENVYTVSGGEIVSATGKQTS